MPHSVDASTGVFPPNRSSRAHTRGPTLEPPQLIPAALGWILLAGAYFLAPLEVGEPWGRFLVRGLRNTVIDKESRFVNPIGLSLDYYSV